MYRLLMAVLIVLMFVCFIYVTYNYNSSPKYLYELKHTVWYNDGTQESFIGNYTSPCSSSKLWTYDHYSCLDHEYKDIACYVKRFKCEELSIKEIE